MACHVSLVRDLERDHGALKQCKNNASALLCAQWFWIARLTRWTTNRRMCYLFVKREVAVNDPTTGRA